MTQERSEASNGSSVLYTKESPSKKVQHLHTKSRRCSIKKKVIKWAQQATNCYGLSRAASYSVRKERLHRVSCTVKVEAQGIQRQTQIRRKRDYRTGSELLLNSVRSPQCKCRLILRFVWLTQFSVIMLSETFKLKRAIIKRTEKQMQTFLTLCRINWLYNHLIAIRENGLKRIRKNAPNKTKQH